MVEYKIYQIEKFDLVFNKLDYSEQIRVNNILSQLREHGAQIGKPLSGLSFFREKKFGDKRLYYLIYPDLKIILVVAISDKKTQQDTIDEILSDLTEYKKYVNMLFNKKD